MSRRSILHSKRVLVNVGDRGAKPILLATREKPPARGDHRTSFSIVVPPRADANVPGEHHVVSTRRSRATRALRRFLRFHPEERGRAYLQPPRRQTPVVRSKDQIALAAMKSAAIRAYNAKHFPALTVTCTDKE